MHRIAPEYAGVCIYILASTLSLNVRPYIYAYPKANLYIFSGLEVTLSPFRNLFKDHFYFFQHDMVVNGANITMGQALFALSTYEGSFYSDTIPKASSRHLLTQRATRQQDSPRPHGQLIIVSHVRFPNFLFIELLPPPPGIILSTDSG